MVNSAILAQHGIVLRQSVGVLLLQAKIADLESMKKTTFQELDQQSLIALSFTDSQDLAIVVRVALKYFCDLYSHFLFYALNRPW
ncbi:hypothetical protein TNCV_3518631 [Trichonephila clavipes]|uniref:Uncharacterized protein n=1 Tax=Trichonephila clavipes TaxID=2585209 RepID=A0A8X6T319_TRICX|nr:hypothetical protein TNCV_3518631 [Trichonephila clavipes]